MGEPVEMPLAASNRQEPLLLTGVILSGSEDAIYISMNVGLSINKWWRRCLFFIGNNRQVGIRGSFDPYLPSRLFILNVRY